MLLDLHRPSAWYRAQHTFLLLEGRLLPSPELTRAGGEAVSADRSQTVHGLIFCIPLLRVSLFPHCELPADRLLFQISEDAFHHLQGQRRIPQGCSFPTVKEGNLSKTHFLATGGVFP